MLFLASSSVPSVSVTYGSVYAGLFLQEVKGKDIKYASMNRVGEIVAQMPESARKTLLAPIEQRLIDPQSVFYLIDDKHQGQIAICVDDFVQLVSECSTKESRPRELTSGGAENLVVPSRLLDAWRLMSDKLDGYSNIDEYSSGYSSSAGGVLSEENVSYLPIVPEIPESRPPALSLNSYFSSCSGNQQGASEFDSKETNVTCISSVSNRRASSPGPVPRSTNSSLTIAQMTSSSSIRTLIPNLMQSGQTESQVTLNDKHSIAEQKMFQDSFEIDHQQKEKNNYSSVFRCSKRATLIIAGAAVVMIFLAASIGVFFIFTEYPRNTDDSTMTTNSPLRETIKYDCVNGSTTEIFFDHKMMSLLDLKISEKNPTRIAGSLEYLFVPNKTQWRYAITYCAVWCGYLVSIKSQKENELVLELTNSHLLPEFGNSYWIGIKGWKGGWYLDDESNVTYNNFPDPSQATHEIANAIQETGCVQADSKGVWSLLSCEEERPFICERNTTHIKNWTPFYPHQEKPCSDAGGRCKYSRECHDSNHHHKPNLCPTQAVNIGCCFPNNPKPKPSTNSTRIKTCVEAGGICNHVELDECRNGRVIFDLSISCPDRPKKYDCCVENDENWQEELSDW